MPKSWQNTISGIVILLVVGLVTAALSWPNRISILETKASAIESRIASIDNKLDMVLERLAK